jgi:hypothetical protein
MHIKHDEKYVLEINFLGGNAFIKGFATIIYIYWYDQ